MKITPARCSARRTDGTPCRRYPIKGAAVCATHGGRAPAVRAKAAIRLLEASDVAASYLVSVVQNEALPADIRLRAATDLLNRANLSGKERIEVELGPVQEKPLWEQIIPQVLIAYTDPEPNSATSAVAAPRALEAVPPADSEAARVAGEAARKAKDPVPPGWVERVDGPSKKTGRRRR